MSKKFALGTLENGAVELFFLESFLSLAEARAKSQETLNELYPAEGLVAVERDEIDDGLHVLFAVPDDTADAATHLTLPSDTNILGIFDLEAGDKDGDGDGTMPVRTKTENLKAVVKAVVAEYLEELDEDEESDDGLYRPYLAANRTLQYDLTSECLHINWEVFVTDSQVYCEDGTWIADELEINPNDSGAKAIGEAVELIKFCWDPAWDKDDSAVYDEDDGCVEVDEDGDVITRSDYNRRQNDARVSTRRAPPCWA